MECKFLQNGVAIQYHNFVKPCCTWKADDQWVQEHNINKIDLVNWHNHPDLMLAKEQLKSDIWPKGCVDCELVENQGRQDSIRLNGISAYGHYDEKDITLEIRPGNVCNFACQTCWTVASTRVADYYKKAGLKDPFAGLIKNDFKNYDFLLPVVHRLKSIIILGGEPFYDPKCLEFLAWCKKNTKSDILAFTNGSSLDHDLIASFPGKFTLVFSFDAVGQPAEYIRFGTDWPKVLSNFNQARSIKNVEIRVNITTSVYNFYYFPDVIDLLVSNWPAVVSFGPAMEEHFSEKVIPIKFRHRLIERLETSVAQLLTANIEKDQKSNAVNAVNTIINNLKTLPYDPELHDQFKDYVNTIDTVKKANLKDYCPEIAELLD